jgi:hypothetical protein
LDAAGLVRPVADVAFRLLSQMKAIYLCRVNGLQWRGGALYNLLPQQAGSFSVSQVSGPAGRHSHHTVTEIRESFRNKS